MRVSEIFTSFQGEGFLTGMPSIFIRVAGCPLRCRFCDTRYAQSATAGTDIPLEEILNKVQKSANSPVFPEFRTSGEDVPRATDNIRHIVLTGGEPMTCPDSVNLTAALRERGFHITVETCGTRDLNVTCDLMSISPKMSNSGNPAPLRDVSATLPKLAEKYEYQIKFVVDSESDLTEIEEFLAQNSYLCRDRILLMAQGQTAEEIAARESWLRNYGQSHDLQLSLRAHLFWFGNRRGC